MPTDEQFERMRAADQAASAMDWHSEPPTGWRGGPNIDQPKGPGGPCCLRRLAMERDDERRRARAFAQSFRFADFDNISTISDHDITLSALRLAARQMLPNEIADGLELRTWRDEAFMSLMLEIRLKVLKEDLGREAVTAKATATATALAEVSIPVTWWDHWKWAHLGSRWSLVRRFVRWRGVRLRAFTAEKTDTETVVDSRTFDKHLTWPEIPIRPRSWGEPVRVALPVYPHV